VPFILLYHTWDHKATAIAKAKPAEAPPAVTAVPPIVIASASNVPSK